MKRGLIDTLRSLMSHWPVLAIGLALVGGIGLSGAYLAAQRQAYEDAAREAARCRELAQQIMEVRGADPVAARVTGPAAQSSGNADDGSAKIGSAAHAAGIAMENIDRIEHDDGQRVGSSPYVRRQTEISLRGLSLERVVDFIDELQSGPTLLVPQSLNVSTANRPGDGNPQQDSELWDVVLSVASVQYEPTAFRGSMTRDDR
jgi:hypothetical protein